MPFKACPAKDADAQDQCIQLGSPITTGDTTFGTVDVCLCSQEAEWESAFKEAFNTATACGSYPSNFQADLLCATGSAGTAITASTQTLIKTGVTKPLQNMCDLSARTTALTAAPAVTSACAGVFPLADGKTSSDIADYDGYLLSLTVVSAAAVEDVLIANSDLTETASPCKAAGASAANCFRAYGA